MKFIFENGDFFANLFVALGALGVVFRFVLRLRDDDREQTRRIDEIEKQLKRSQAFGRNNSSRLAKIEFTIETHEETLSETRIWMKQVEETLLSIDHNLTVLTTKLNLKE